MFNSDAQRRAIFARLALAKQNVGHAIGRGQHRLADLGVKHPVVRELTFGLAHGLIARSLHNSIANFAKRDPDLRAYPNVVSAWSAYTGSVVGGILTQGSKRIAFGSRYKEKSLHPIPRVHGIGFAAGHFGPMLLGLGKNYAHATVNAARSYKRGSANRAYYRKYAYNPARSSTPIIPMSRTRGGNGPWYKPLMLGS